MIIILTAYHHHDHNLNCLSPSWSLSFLTSTTKNHTLINMYTRYQSCMLSTVMNCFILILPLLIIIIISIIIILIINVSSFIAIIHWSVIKSPNTLFNIIIIITIIVTVIISIIINNHHNLNKMIRVQIK